MRNPKIIRVLESSEEKSREVGKKREELVQRA